MLPRWAWGALAADRMLAWLDSDAPAAEPIRRLRELELGIFDGTAAVLAVSQMEKEVIVRLRPNALVAVASNVMFLPEAPAAPVAFAARSGLLFVGNMRHIPNRWVGPRPPPSRLLREGLDWCLSPCWVPGSVCCPLALLACACSSTKDDTGCWARVLNDVCAFLPACLPARTPSRCRQAIQALLRQVLPHLLLALPSPHREGLQVHIVGAGDADPSVLEVVRQHRARVMMHGYLPDKEVRTRNPVPSTPRPVSRIL